MKKTFTLLSMAFALFLLCGKAQAQCPQEGVYFFSQADINAFAADYPDCTEFQYEMLISDFWSGSITDLSPLSNLTSVGSLTITWNTQLTSLSGLDNLTSVGEWLEIVDNDQLTSLSGLESLISSSEEATKIKIGQNDLLTDISALQNINPEIIGEIDIFDNPVLSVCNLPNFCTYLQGPGDRNISGNAGDCISEQAVLDTCSMSLPQCPEEGINFFTQADINAFAADYPDCTELQYGILIS